MCWCVCVMLAGGPTDPGSPPRLPDGPTVYPAAHSLPGAALKPTGDAMRGGVPSISLCFPSSLLQFICLRPLRRLIAYCFCWHLRPAPEQPNKSVIHRRAACAAAAAKQSTGRGFMAGFSTLEYATYTRSPCVILFFPYWNHKWLI